MRALSLSINYMPHWHPKWTTFSIWLKGRKCHKLNISMAHQRLKSPWSLSGTSAHPTMVTLVNIMVMDGWIASFSLQVDWLYHSWDKAISDSDLETPRSRSWVWSKGKVIQSAQYPINSPHFHFTSMRPTIPEIQLFWNLTLCGVRHGMLPRASGITNAREHSSWMRRSVRGNGGCFNPRVGVFVCLTPMSLDLLRGWVPKTVSSPEWAESVAVSRPWEWPERGICEAWSTTLVERYQRIVYVQCVCVSDMWAPVPWQWRTHELVMGIGKGWNKRWVPCEKGELGKFSRQWWQRYFEPAPRRLMMFTSRSVIESFTR